MKLMKMLDMSIYLAIIAKSNPFGELGSNALLVAITTYVKVILPSFSLLWQVSIKCQCQWLDSPIDSLI